MLEFRVVESQLGPRGRFGRQLPAPPDTPVFQTALGWSCWPGTGRGRTVLFLHILGAAPFILKYLMSGSYMTSYRMEVVMDCRLQL